MSSDKGYIVLYRDIREHWIWRDPERLKAWIDLIMMVNHEDKKILFDGSLLKVKRGSTITSIRILAEKWGWSQGKVARFLDVLESEQMITQKRSTKNTAISIENYGFYQGRKNKNGAPTEHRQSADGEQTENRQRTDGDKQYTIKNDKDIINIKNNKESSHRPLSEMTDEELEAEGWGFD